MNVRSVASALVWSGILACTLVAGCGDDEATHRPPATVDAGAGGACEPRTCQELDVQCGEVDDGCGRSIICGDACSGGQGGGGGAGTSCADAVQSAPVRSARRARSAGFEAGDDAYLELFDVACDDASVCVDECATRGGTEEMCGASECLPAVGAGNACVPAPIWGNLESIQVEDASVFDMSQIVMVTTDYRDTLLVDDFGLDVPDSARIRGITVEVRRAGDASVVDDTVRLLKGGSVVGAEHGSSDAWSDEPTWVTYGGEDEAWSETWTAADLNAQDFGVALSAQYTGDAGNTRAYVDQVRVTISYSACD